MNREDEIKRAKESVYGDGTCRAAHHFETGVRWADAHPADETIQRIVMLYKQWYTTESTMSMVDYIKQHLKS